MTGGRVSEPNKKVAPDWVVIERDYRAGIKPLRQIGDEHGISHAAVKKRANKEGWPRDLAAKIAAKTEEKVSKAAVTRAVTVETKIAENEVIEANAQMQADRILKHREDIGEGREIVMSLMGELRLQCGAENAALLEELGDMMRRPDEHGQDKLNDLYMKIVSLPGRAKTMKDMTESLAKLIWLEREAFGIDSRFKGGEEKPAFVSIQF